MSAPRPPGRRELSACCRTFPGPKIRTGPLKQRAPIVLKTGDELHIVVGDEPGEPGRISTTFYANCRTSSVPAPFCCSMTAGFSCVSRTCAEATFARG